MKRIKKGTADAERHRRTEVNTLETEQMKEEVEIRDQNLKENTETIETVAEI